MDLDDEELKATRRMNGSDKNVACIEKEIKILEEIKDMFIHLKNYGWINDIKKDIDTDKAIQAIEHLIKAYKELEEGNKEKAEMLTQQNRNLQISYDSLRELFELRKYKNNSIPVSLVEEKIEELNKAYEDSKDENGESEYYYPDYTIRVLEELLEKRK